MEFSIRRWKPGQLLASWGLYWVGLIGATSVPALLATWRATQLPEGHGNISASIDNAIVSYTVVEDGVKTLSASASISTILAWVVGPPLLIWLVWLFSRQRPIARDAAAANESTRASALPGGSAPASEWRSNQNERVGVEREGIRTPNP